MKIRIAQSAGFCFGVRRAITIALNAAASGKPVCMLGDIVHNEDVVRQITGAGIKKIRSLTRVKNKVLLIRAHGATRKTFERAKQLGYAIIDATCPMVKEIHTIARNMEQQGHRIIVIGDKKHDEVKGIVGNLKTRAIVIEHLDSLPQERLQKISKACVVVQSTQNLSNVLPIITTLRRSIPHLVLRNTICKPTTTKQNEIKKMPRQNDVMIIIGSRHSANTKRLYEISKALNTKSYWINSAAELQKAWFGGAASAGITAGASTPQSTIQSVVARIKRITR